LVLSQRKKAFSTFYQHCIRFSIQKRSHEHFYLLILFSCKFDNFNNFVTLASTRVRLPEDDAYASKHVGVLTIYKILYIYIYIYSAFAGLDNKLYKTHGSYIKIHLNISALHLIFNIWPTFVILRSTHQTGAHKIILTVHTQLLQDLQLCW